MKRRINAIWKGDGSDGIGILNVQSGAFKDMPYGTLGTNPEELIASALAGCFNMKLSFDLNEANFNPENLNTDAILSFEDGKILSIELNLKGKVPNISEDKFYELANNAKDNCPISGVLNCDISLNITLL